MTIEYHGEDQMLGHDIWMDTEDFTYFSQLTDDCFYLLCVGIQGKELPLMFIRQPSILMKMQ